MSASTTAMKGEDPLVIRFMMLPDDLILNCLARVSRLYYPILSLVSKRFRILIASTELYHIRVLLGCIESGLYVCLRSSTHGANPLRWFTLCHRPGRAEKVLVPILSPNSPTDFRTKVAAVGPYIYAFGGLINYNASSSVMVMDCRSNTWSEAPSMGMARMAPSACVLDEKIYVVGGCAKLNSTNWIEVFDTNTQTWEFLQIPSEKICLGSIYKSVGYEGTIHVRSEELGVTCKLYKGRWREADLMMNKAWGLPSTYCVIANVFYRCGGCKIYWYDSKERIWKTLKGLEGLSSFYRNGDVKLAEYGEKMAVLWEEFVHVENYRENIIWCAEIALERHINWGIRGTVEWFGKVFTSKEPYRLVHAFASTL
ncbi:Kelch-type beta propeller [Arabidopsis thaliana x Arabidopsis arenosa]|uniref:Kelch-type beta propeller n=1 Tax=Arabidopsis thaliana x Arabidopsis arenosa TaxID=1240361 RepID=A0A8T2BZX6_9BRAS|nr:Kelch-type beta propeller [Arabidopsis thaliana x Arabidopsis arenosa]